MVRFFLLLFFFITGFFSSAQDLPITTQQQLENLALSTENEIQQDDDFLQDLLYFEKHPVNLNRATKEELLALHFLTDLQIRYFFAYQKLAGKLIDIYELQSIPGWDIYTVKKILPYVTVRSPNSLRGNNLRGNQSLLFRASSILEKSRGYDTSLRNHYLGSPAHLFIRYTYRYKNSLQFGLVADKDPGEQFFRGAQSNGFDFYSFHLFIHKQGILKDLAIGDYRVNLGQGLIEWQSLAFGKSNDITAIKRQGPVLLPYRSSGEFNFSRGVGATLKKGSVEATAFVSLKKISGNIASDSTDIFTSFLMSGLHRNASEIAKRNNIRQLSFGGNISYNRDAFKIGLNSVIHHFSLPLKKRDKPYNYYSFSGDHLFNSSVDYSYTYKNVHLFGEYASDNYLHKAFIDGMLLSVDAKVDIAVLYRNISKEYQSLTSNAFTENSLASNEKGLYTGLVLKFNRSWQLNAYADIYEFPWIKYLTNAPVKGHDYSAQLSYQAKQFEFYINYESRNKPVNNSDSGVIYNPERQARKKLQIRFMNRINPALSIKTRLETVWLNDNSNKEEGYLGLIESSYLISNRFKSVASLQYFETESYASRLYVYEPGILYASGIPSFYGKGFRYYFTFNFEPGKKLNCWVRWSQTVYDNKSETGSGLDKIIGSKKSQAEVQFQYVL